MKNYDLVTRGLPDVAEIEKQVALVFGLPEAIWNYLSSWLVGADTYRFKPRCQFNQVPTWPRLWQVLVLA